MRYLLAYTVLFFDWLDKKETELSESQRSRLVYFFASLAFILFFVLGRFN